MTDHNTSGADFAPGAAPSKTDGQAPASFAETGASGASQPIGAFGSVRGSGLARGKRTSSPAASAAPAVKTGEYKPTALEVIVPEREYKNPFTGETAVARPEPVVEAPPEAPAPAPARPVSVSAPSSREYITPQPEGATPSAPLPAPVFERSVEEATETRPEEKSELTILPPAQPQKSSLSWESSPAGAAPAAPIFPLEPRREGRRDERSSSRGEGRREPRAEGAPGAEGYAPRAPREGRPEGGERRRDGREPRQEIDPRYGRQHPDPRDYPDGYQPSWYARRPRREDREPSRHHDAAPAPADSAAPEAAAKPAGFFGWLKGLFGGKPAAQPQRTEGERSHDGQHRGRRRRGGRGRHQGESRGGYGAESRGAGPGSDSAEGGESRGGYGGGGDRRRSRGGRGRGRGREDRGGFRSEGSQGGGAI
jgi:translation initiation factor IF-2